MDEILLIERRGGYAIVTLNRPKSLNALSMALMRRIVEVMAELDRDDEIGGIILTGAGRAFCAGMDMKELQDPDGPLAGDDGLWGDDVPNAVRAVMDFSKPAIAAVNGAAVTGGFELALACDLIVASSEARFADTHARLGIIPGGGASQMVSRIIGPHRAKEMHLTGNFVSAQQADRWGLVNHVVEPAALIDTAEQLMLAMLEIKPHIRRTFKKLVNDGFALPFGEALRLEEAVARGDSVQVDPHDIAARGASIVERGRAQG